MEMKWLRALFNCNKKSKMNTISFLIGSGFSKADGLPLVGEINKRFRNIDENEIEINSERISWFKQDKKPNYHPSSKQNERKFVQEFLKFYCTQVIYKEEDFHYEEFFDYYNDYRRIYYKDDSHPINLFCENFRSSYMEPGSFGRDNFNLIGDFHEAFNQLLAFFLQRVAYYEDVSYLDYGDYNNIIAFLKEVFKKSFIKVHTLNHDLLFERVASVSPLWEEFSDGYSENNSPYYSEAPVNQNNVRKSYRVRLKSFQNKFDKNICLFKLHGSIDTYQFHIGSPYQDLTRVKSDYGLKLDFVKEILNPKNNEYEYQHGLQERYPDFLTGTTTKMLSYDNEYYQILFCHFKENLEKSKLLIVIGYGFGDKGINDYVEKHFLKKGGKMVVILPSKPSSSLMDYPNVGLIPKKLEQVSVKEFMDILK